MRRHIGVVAAVTPWNFPIAIPSWKIAPAIITGNTVVFKPAEDTPILALRLVEILVEAGLPAGVVNVVFGARDAIDAPQLDRNAHDVAETIALVHEVAIDLCNRTRPVGRFARARRRQGPAPAEGPAAYPGRR